MARVSSSEFEIDYQQLVEQRHLLHQLAPCRTDDVADGGGLIERRQHGADGQPLLVLQVDQPPQVGELAVVVVRLGEPAVDARGDAAALLRRPVGGLE